MTAKFNLWKCWQYFFLVVHYLIVTHFNYPHFFFFPCLRIYPSYERSVLEGQMYFRAFYARSATIIHLNIDVWWGSPLMAITLMAALCVV